MNKKKTILAVVFVLLIVVFVGFSYLTEYLAGVVKTNLTDVTYDKTGFELEVDAVDLNILRGDARATGLFLNDAKRRESPVMAEALTVDTDPWSLLGDMVRINRVNLVKLDVALDIDRNGNLKVPNRPSRPAPAATERGFRIDSISVNAERIVVRHEISEGKRIDWELRPLDATVKGVLVPPPVGSKVLANLSAILLEPSKGNITAELHLKRTKNAWDASCRQKVQINRVEALNPYLPVGFPLVATSGSLVLTDDLAIHGSIFETTVTVALSQPRFTPRERSVRSLFKGSMSQFAVQAIKDAKGDIVLDPIYIHGNLSDPQFDPKAQLVADLRTQLLGRIFGGTKSIPSDIARKLTGSLSTLPRVPGKVGAVLQGVQKASGKVLGTRTGLAGEAKKVGGTAGEAAKNIGSRLKKLFGK